jgi:hypothetical protein
MTTLHQIGDERKALQPRSQRHLKTQEAHSGRVVKKLKTKNFFKTERQNFEEETKKNFLTCR